MTSRTSASPAELARTTASTDPLAHPCGVGPQVVSPLAGGGQAGLGTPVKPAADQPDPH